MYQEVVGGPQSPHCINTQNTNSPLHNPFRNKVITSNNFSPNPLSTQKWNSTRSLNPPYGFPRERQRKWTPKGLKKKISQWNPHYSLVSISSDLPTSKSEYKIPANGGKKQPHRSTRHYNFSWNPQSNSSSPPSHNTLSLSRSLSFSSWWKAQFVTRKEFLLAKIKNKQTKQDAFFLHHLIQLFLV